MPGPTYGGLGLQAFLKAYSTDKDLCTAFGFAVKSTAKIAKGDSKKRGCKAHFSVSQCYADETVARITCPGVGLQHANHGKMAEGTKFAVEGKLSDSMLDWIGRRLTAGMQPRDIMREHIAVLAGQLEGSSEAGAQMHRDNFLNMQDIRNTQCRLSTDTWRLSSNVGHGIFLWTEAHHESVFCFEQQKLTTGNGLLSCSRQLLCPCGLGLSLLSFDFVM